MTHPSFSNGQPIERADRPASTTDRLLLGIVDGGMAATIFAAPFFMGGRHPVGQLVVVVLAVVVAIAWMARGFLSGPVRWRSCPLQWLIVVAVLLMLLQITDLPRGLLEAISPSAQQTLSLWGSAADNSVGLGSWSTVSMTPQATRDGIVMFVAYGLLLLIAVQRIESIHDVERLLRWIAVSTFLMASFALLQYLTSNGKFFWFYEYPFRHNRRSVHGMFTNPNHFAHLLALGVGPLIWWIHQAVVTPASNHNAAQGFGRSSFGGNEKSFAVVSRVMMLGIVLFAGAMTRSRGGIAVLLLALAICTGLYYRSRLFGRKAIFAIGGLSLMVAISLAVHGYQSVSRELDDFTSGDIEDLDPHGMRASVFAATFKAARGHLALGTGVGSFRDVHPRYLDRHFKSEFTHAENGYLQIAMESGLPGIALLLICILLCARWVTNTLRDPMQSRLIAAASAVVAGLACSILHSMFDFVWYLPSLIAITALLVACLFRLNQSSQRETPSHKITISSPIALALTAASCLLAVVMISNRIGPAQASSHWDQYLRLSLAQKAFDPNSVEQAEAVEQMITQLQQVVRHTPNNARAHLRLASVHLRRFNQQHELSKQKRGEQANDMTIYNLRDAALEGGFEQLAKRTLEPHDANRDGWLAIEEIQQNRTLIDQFKRGDVNSDRRMSFAELRQVQLADWLVRAFGQHCQDLVPAFRHTKRALHASPSQGEAYLTLAKVYFLGDTNLENKDRFVNQAIALRPHDPDVLLDAGHEAQHMCIRARNEAQSLARLATQKPAYQKRYDEKIKQMQHYAKLAVDCWKPCFRQGPAYQRKIIRMIGTNQATIVTFINDFEPSTAALMVMQRHYEQIDNARLEQFMNQKIASRASSEAEQNHGLEAARRWLDAQKAYARLEQHDAAGKCAENAVHQAPDDYKVHRSVGTYYLQRKNFDDAVTHLRWCANRRPDDSRLQKILRQAITGQIEQSPSSAIAPTGARRLR